LLVDSHRRHELGQVGDVLDLVTVELPLWPKALMAIGVSCRLVSRLVAVTVISSSCVASAAAGAVWAWTAVAAIIAATAEVNRPIGFYGASSSSLSLRAIFFGRDLRAVNSYSTTTLSISHLFAT
jgi:hypothetical protein